MTTPRIGVDIDGVMYQWTNTARYMLREIMPNSPYRKDGPLGTECTSWGYLADHISKEHMKWLWTEGVRLGLFRHGHLYPGVIEAVRELAAVGDVVLITHRPKTAVNDTLAWAAYQNLPLSGVHMLTNEEPKSSVRPQCQAYIDDKPSNCVDLRANTGAAIVAIADREWNRGVNIPGVRRVASLREFAGTVRKEIK